MKRMSALSAVLLVGVSAYAQEPEQTDQDSSALLALSSPSITAVQDTSKGKPPDAFVDVDIEPEVIKKVEPYYPEIALKAGMEGKVWVKIWIDSTGAVRDVVVLKSDAEIFDAPSIQAARQFVFKPAYSGGRPVAVWVSVPFRYKLSTKPDSVREVPPRISLKDSVLLAAVRGLLEGRSSQEELSGMIIPYATVISQGTLKELSGTVLEQQAGKHSIEDSGRKAVYVTGNAFDRKGLSYVVYRTEPLAGKGARHYHTIIYRHSPDGTPAILHWHVGK